MFLHLSHLYLEGHTTSLNLEIYFRSKSTNFLEIREIEKKVEKMDEKFQEKKKIQNNT